MKRILCLLISVVAFSLTVTASADSNQVLTVQNISSDAILNDWAKMLKLGEEINNIVNDKSIYENLHSDNPPDFFGISGYELSRFRDEDLCASFSPSEKMLDEIHAMPPIIQQVLKESIYTEDGKLYAYPHIPRLWSIMFYVPEVWKDSPFRDLTPPSSYVDLLDFLEKYLDTPHDGYCFYYDVVDKRNPQLDWVGYLIKSWVLQCRYNHQDFNLNNPEFISLLKRTIELSNRLQKAEPNKKSQKGRQLFTGNHYGFTTNGQDQFTWENAIPWRITSDQLPLMLVSIDLYCVRKNSSFANEATELFDCFIDHQQDPEDGEIFYLRYLFQNKDWIDINKWNNQVLKQYGSRRKYYCMTQDYVDSIWEMEKYAVPCMIDENYLTYTTWDMLEEYDNLTLNCVKGIISAEDYVIKMDELARSNE